MTHKSLTFPYFFHQSISSTLCVFSWPSPIHELISHCVLLWQDNSISLIQYALCLYLHAPVTVPLVGEGVVYLSSSEFSSPPFVFELISNSILIRITWSCIFVFFCLISLVEVFLQSDVGRILYVIYFMFYLSASKSYNALTFIEELLKGLLVSNTEFHILWDEQKVFFSSDTLSALNVVCFCQYVPFTFQWTVFRHAGYNSNKSNSY